jgi:hypothetical protein
LQGLAENLLRGAVRIDVGGVEQGDPGLQAEVDQPPRLDDVGVAPGAEQRALAAEGAGPEAEGRYPEARLSELTIVLGVFLS